MVMIRAFPALRPAPETAAKVSSVPYDVVSTEEARKLAAGNPLSFLHVSRPEIDLPDGADPHGEEVYRKAAENFEKLEAAAPLVSEGDPSLYVYRLRAGSHEQTGVAACCSIDEYDAGEIKRHERTRRDKEDDRTRHMITLSAQTGPVFLTYRDSGAVDGQVRSVRGRSPLYDFEAEDGTRHTLWRMATEEAYATSRAFDAVPALYIADGHHRAASARRARDHYKALAPADGGQDPFNFFLAVIFPASQVQILAYNRVVKGLNGMSADDFLDALRKRFRVVEGAPAAPKARRQISVYLHGQWYGLTPLDPLRTPSNELDVTILQEGVLAPILGIHDIRTDERIEFVGGGRGTSELERLVDTGKATVAFSLYPVSLAELMTISDSDEIMPPKSTWFEPKLRDGLLIHQIR